MKRIDALAEQYKKTWLTCSSVEIDSCFDYKDENEAPLKAVSGLELAEDISKETYDDFIGALNAVIDKTDHRVSLSLGVAEVPNAPSPITATPNNAVASEEVQKLGITIFFDFEKLVTEKNNSGKDVKKWVSIACYGLDSLEKKKTQDNNPSAPYITGIPMPTKIKSSSLLRFGVSPALVRQFSNNWLRTTPNMRSLMFYGTQTKNRHDEPAKILREVVRGKRYKLSNTQVEILTKVVRKGSDISILFGVNPSNFYMEDDLFTLIICVDNKNSTEFISEYSNDDNVLTVDTMTFIEFVHICPPFCDPPNGVG